MKTAIFSAAELQTYLNNLEKQGHKLAEVPFVAQVDDGDWHYGVGIEQDLDGEGFPTVVLRVRN